MCGEKYNMNISCITLTYNDDYKLAEWKKNYEIIKDQISHYIIIDNHSCDSYKELLASTFPEAIIIYRDNNGGCSGAYNDGIKYALANTDDEAIAIIGNDIMLAPDCLKVLYEYLFSRTDLGIVSSALLKKDSNLVEDFGVQMQGFRSVFNNIGESYESLGEKTAFVDIVPGGFNMAKRSFYQTAGLLDESLFMYCEELDTMYRAKANHYKSGVTSVSCAWHQHINPPGARKQRRPETHYMIGRNKIYLTKKHEGSIKAILSAIYVIIIMPSLQLFHFLKSGDIAYAENAKYTLLGGIYGIKMDMKPNKYSLPINE